MYATGQKRPQGTLRFTCWIAERLGLAHLDWPLAIAAVALVAFSVFTLGQATLHDVPGSPHYYVDRQALYGLLGLLGMFVLSRIDYSRFRELRVGIYTFLCASVALVFVFGFAARGSRRSFELPLFSFQPSELGKLLLVLALAGFVIDGARRGSARQRTVRYLCCRCFPGSALFLSARTSAPRWCCGVATLAVMPSGCSLDLSAVSSARLSSRSSLFLFSVVPYPAGTPVLKRATKSRD